MNTLSAFPSKKLKYVLMVACCCAGLYSAKAQTTAAQTVKTEDAETANRTDANFPGGMGEFYNYLASQIRLDSTCVAGKKVQVAFMVDKKGKIKKARVERHVLSDKMDAQLVKIFEAAPQWTPARQNGHDIKEHFVCPIMFMPKTDLMAANQPVKQ